MPDRIYLPLRTDATYSHRQRIAAHWEAFGIAFASGGLGTVILLAGILRALIPPAPPGLQPWEQEGVYRLLNPAPSLAELPVWQGPAVGATMVVGAALWLRAALTTYPFLEDFWRVQRAGIGLLWLSWTVYALCAGLARPEWLVPWWLGACLSAIHAGQFILSLQHQKRVRGSWRGDCPFTELARRMRGGHQ